MEMSRDDLNLKDNIGRQNVIRNFAGTNTGIKLLTTPDYPTSFGRCLLKGIKEYL